MKKYIILLIPLIVGCSFQVKESEGYEERLSRRPYVEEKDIYSEFTQEGEFRGYEYEQTLPLVDYSVDDRERFSRKSFFFDDMIETENTGEKKYELDLSYQEDELNYNVNEGEPEIIREIESGEDSLKLDIFK